MTAAPVVLCSGVVHVYRVAGTDVAALRGVDLRVETGERVALLGPSGSGKSTLLAILAGILRPSAGRVTVFGTDVGAAKSAALRQYRSSIGIVLQAAETNLLPFATPAENVAYARRAAPRRAQGLHAAQRILAAVGAAAHLGPVGRLHPSARQGVALAVAMATAPRLLLADEPTNRLDDIARTELLNVLLEVAAEVDTTIVVVTHDESVAARLGRMIHLREGRVGAEATSRRELRAVVGADGAVQLPEDLLGAFPPGSLVEVERVAPGEILMRRPPDA